MSTDPIKRTDGTRDATGASLGGQFDEVAEHLIYGVYLPVLDDLDFEIASVLGDPLEKIASEEGPNPRSIFKRAQEVKAKLPEDVQRWLTKTFWSQPVGRRLSAVQIEQSNNPESVSWISQGEPNVVLDKTEAKAERGKLIDYVRASALCQLRITEEFLPSNKTWIDLPKLLGQLVALADGYEFNPGVEDARRKFSQDERQRYHKQAAYPDRRIEYPSVAAWIALNEPIFRHYQFTKKDVLREVLKRFRYFGKSPETFRKNPAHLDAAVEDAALAFESYTNRLGLRGLRRGRYSADIAPYLVLLYDLDTDVKTVSKL